MTQTNFNDMIKNVENCVIIDQHLQGCHYVIYGLISMKLSAGAFEMSSFIGVSPAVAAKNTQRTLLYVYSFQFQGLVKRLE